MLRRLLVPALAIGVVAALVAPNAASALDTSEPPLLAVALTDETLTLDGPDAATAVPESGTLAGTLHLGSALPDGTIAAEVTLALDGVDGPGHATLGLDGASLTAPGDTAVLPTDGDLPATLTFDTPGDYTLTLAATTEVRTLRADDATTLHADPIALAFEVAAPAPEADPAPAPDADPPSTGSEPAAAAAAAPAEADVPERATAEDPVVLSSGNISLTPRFTGVDMDAYTFTGFDLGLLDKTGDYADQKWYSPDDAVINVTDAERDEATGLWQTPASVGDVAGYTTGDDARLLLGRDAAAAAGGINSAGKDAIGGLPQGPMTLVGANAPDGGRLRVMSKTATLDAPSWDSQTLASGGAQTALTAPKLNKSTYDGWAFDTAGTYCVTVSQTFAPGDSSAAEITEQATYTIVVGDLPDHITTCGHDSDGSGDDGDGSGSGPTPVTRMTTGHLDVRSWLDEAGDALDFGIYTTPDARPTYTLSKDLVLGGTHEGTIPEPNDVSDLSFIGPVGSTYYYFNQAVANPDEELWPGFSGENWSGGKTAPFQGLSTTLAGVTGPSGGQVILFGDPASTNDGASAPEYVYYDSAWGMPMTRTDLNASHTHMNWAFTQPGRYCLSFTTQAPLADGRTLSGAGQLTVWAGDAGDISSAEPCDRDTTPATGGTLPDPTPATVSAPVVSTQGLDEIQPYLEDGTLKAPVQTRVQTSADAEYYDLDDTIFSTARKIGSYYQLTQQGGASPTLRVRTDRIAPKDIDGPVTVTMGDVQGPGPVYTSSVPGKPLLLNSGADGRSLSYTQPARSYQSLAFRVDVAGVYCVPLTWSVTPAGSSTPVTVSKTLTLVAGSTVKGDADYLDRSKLTTCAHGQQATMPGDDDGSGDDPGDGDSSGPSDADVYVPNGSLTDSGAVIVNDGHVDLASKVEGDTLETWLKDGTVDAENPTYHPVAGSHSLDSGERGGRNNGNATVFQILPEGRTSVPSGSTFAFLGAPGAPLWQVEQTQQDGLLWPGWSTEDIPLAATQTGVRWSLDRISGPGEFALYESQLSDVDVLFNTRDGVTAADSFEIAKNAHVHGSWAFSAEGTYCLAFTRSTTMADGTPASDDFTLAVAVGRVDVKRVDPGQCFSTAGQPSATDTTPVPESQLTDATTGGVTVFDLGEELHPGGLVTAQVGASHGGQWVSVWLHSTPVWLGWAQVSASGTVQVRLPADAPVGAHKLVVKTSDGDLIGWDALALTKAPDGGGGGGEGGQAPGDDPVFTAPAAQCTASDLTVLTFGHMDWNAQVVNGKLESYVGDDSTGTRRYLEPSKTVLWLKPSSAVAMTAGYEQIAPANTTLWQIPQTQKQDLVWLGWSTELLNAGNATSPVTWSLTGVEGPGSVKVYTVGSFGGVQQLVFDGPSTTTIRLGSHVHANWAFSRQGVYRLHFTESATLANGQRSSDSEVLTIAVGDVDPYAIGAGAGCGASGSALLASTRDDDAGAKQSAAQVQALAAEAAGARPGTSGRGGQAGVAVDPITALNQGNPVPLLLSILGALLLLGGAGAGVLWWRRRRGEGVSRQAPTGS